MKVEFDIGDWVETKAIVNFGYPSVFNENNIRKMFRDEVTKKGRIVGMAYRCLGIGRPSTYKQQQASLQITSKALVYKVREGMINIPFECLPEDLKRIPPEDFPLCKNHKVIWTKEMRQEMSEYAKDFPRDKRGRFI